MRDALPINDGFIGYLVSKYSFPSLVFVISYFVMNKVVIFAFIIFAGFVLGESCDSCGSECQSACGTRHFRTCCFNYLKKRNDPGLGTLTLDPSVRLELWLARSQNQFLQPWFYKQESTGTARNGKYGSLLEMRNEMPNNNGADFSGPLNQDRERLNLS